MPRRLPLSLGLIVLLPMLAPAQPPASKPIVLKPARVFDGIAERAEVRAGSSWSEGGGIVSRPGPPPRSRFPRGPRSIDLPDATLMLPGLIEAHSHVLLHALR